MTEKLAYVVILLVVNGVLCLGSYCLVYCGATEIVERTYPYRATVAIETGFYAGCRGEIVDRVDKFGPDEYLVRLQNNQDRWIDARDLELVEQ